MLPTDFSHRMMRLLGESFYAYEEALKAPRVTALQINRQKGTCSLPFDTSPVPYYADGQYFTAEKPGNHPLHHAGAFYIQEPSAMAPVAALAGRLSGNVALLDVCASPGGKSSQLANLFPEASMIVSNEIIPNRCKTLVGNVERLGFRNILCLNSDADFLARQFPEAFSAVVCDAPCSGEGMFRKCQEAQLQWSEEAVKLCARRQEDILRKIKNCVCPGGYLLYSTCTFSVEENEENVSRFLEENPDFSLCDPGRAFDACSAPGYAPACRHFNPAWVRRFYPHIAKGEGQFFALFQKEGDGTEAPITGKTAMKTLSREQQAAASSFLKETLGHDALPLYACGDSLFVIPEGMFVPDRHVFSCGVKLGDYQSRRLIPHHQFFSAYGKDFLQKAEFPSDSPDIERYLHGEGFDVSLPDRWTAVTTDGIPVGGAKIVGGYLKNHYPKGLRKN